MPQSDDDVMKIGMTCWFCFCVMLVLWFVSKFLQGRKQLNKNMNVVGEGLKRIQAQLEAEECMNRKKSIGSLENFHDLFKNDSDDDEETKAKKAIFEKAHEMLRTYTEEELEDDNLKKTL